MANTNVISQIGIHATAETTLPSAPTLGGAMDLATASFVVFGSVQDGDDVDLDTDSVTVPGDLELGEVRPPLSIQVEDLNLYNNSPGQFSFVCYDISETLFTLLSNISVTSNVGQVARQLTYRTVVVEIKGKAADYYPRCGVFVDENVAGVGPDGVAKTGVIIRPTATSTYKGGWTRTWYQAE